MQQENNNQKQRKSEAQKRFDEADNAGRFAGDDADARRARTQAEENIRQDAQSNRAGSGNDGRRMGDGEIVDGDQVRPNQANMLEEEAQNIGKDREGIDRLDSDSESEKARNKATQDIKEGRDTGTSADRSRNSGSR